MLGTECRWAGSRRSIARAAALLASDPAPGRRARPSGVLRGRAAGPAGLRLILGSARRRLGRFCRRRRLAGAAGPRAFPAPPTPTTNSAWRLRAWARPPTRLTALRQAAAPQPRSRRRLARAGRPGLQGRRRGRRRGRLCRAPPRRGHRSGPEARGRARSSPAGSREAEALLRRHLAARLDDGAATRMLAEVSIAPGPLSATPRCCSPAAWSSTRSHDGARFSQADALFRQQKAAEAIAHWSSACWRRPPDDPAYLNLLAACLALVGEDAARDRRSTTGCWPTIRGSRGSG